MSCPVSVPINQAKIVRFLETTLKFSTEACAEFKDKAVFEFQAEHPNWTSMEVVEKTEFSDKSKKIKYTVIVRGEG